MGEANITSEDGGVTYVHEPSGCVLAVILTSPQEVDLYAEAGDNVASSPSRSVGVKITDEDEQRCHDALTEALSGF